MLESIFESLAFLPVSLRVSMSRFLKGVRFLQAALGSPSERQTRKRVLHLEGGVGSPRGEELAVERQCSAH